MVVWQVWVAAIGGIVFGASSMWLLIDVLSDEHPGGYWVILASCGFSIGFVAVMVSLGAFSH